MSLTQCEDIIALPQSIDWQLKDPLYATSGLIGVSTTGDLCPSTLKPRKLTVQLICGTNASFGECHPSADVEECAEMLTLVHPAACPVDPSVLTEKANVQTLGGFQPKVFENPFTQQQQKPIAYDLNNNVNIMNNNNNIRNNNNGEVNSNMNLYASNYNNNNMNFNPYTNNGNVDMGTKNMNMNNNNVNMNYNNMNTGNNNLNMNSNGNGFNNGGLNNFNINNNNNGAINNMNNNFMNNNRQFYPNQIQQQQQQQHTNNNNNNNNFNNPPTSGETNNFLYDTPDFTINQLNQQQQQFSTQQPQQKVYGPENQIMFSGNQGNNNAINFYDANPNNNPQQSSPPHFMSTPKAENANNYNFYNPNPAPPPVNTQNDQFASFSGKFNSDASITSSTTVSPFASFDFLRFDDELDELLFEKQREKERQFNRDKYKSAQVGVKERSWLYHFIRIIFIAFGLLFCYVVGGTFINMHFRQKSGLDAVPPMGLLPSAIVETTQQVLSELSGLYVGATGNNSGYVPSKAGYSVV